MKKILTLLLVVAMMLALVACGSQEPTDTQSVAPSTSEQPSESPSTEPSAPVLEEVKGVTVPEFTIMINGVKVDQTMMASYPLYSVQATSVNSAGTESTTTYVGFSMKDVYAAAGLTENYVWLEATADDGYAVTSTGDVVMADTTLLAVSKDGTQFTTSPWYAPCSSQTTGDYLKGLVSILVNTTEGAPEGVTNEPVEGEDTTAPEGLPELQDKTDKVEFSEFSFKVNGQEVTNATLEGQKIYKVTVSTTNNAGETSESTYTGYKLVDVLAACGVEDYSTVKAVANDGYEAELTADQAKSEYTIVAIEKDKELGEDGTIWVAPCEETSSKSYCKLVVEIVAE